MKPNKIVIDDVEYIRADSVKQTPEQNFESDGVPFCIIRTRDAGVHAGWVAEINGDVVRMRSARRLWRWNSAATLSELALYGCVCPSECRYGAPIDIEINGWCEKIQCSEKGHRSIEEVPRWIAKTK